MDKKIHSMNSMLRECIVEHLLIGKILRTLWRRGIYDAEILRSEYDAGGYDLVLTYRDLVRHVQLKTMLDGGKTDEFKIGLRLADRPSGCVICVVVSADLKLARYLWFGGTPGEPLPTITQMKVARHSKGTAKGVKLERAAHRAVQLKKFTEVTAIESLVDCLVGRIAQSNEQD